MTVLGILTQDSLRDRGSYAVGNFFDLSIRLLSEQMEEFLGVVGLYGNVEELCHSWKYGDINL